MVEKYCECERKHGEKTMNDGMRGDACVCNSKDATNCILRILSRFVDEET